MCGCYSQGTHGKLFIISMVLPFSHPVMSDSAAPWTAACQASLFLTISQSLPKFMFTASVMPSSHLILRCPLLLLPSIFPSTGPFPTSCLFASDDQSTGASASVLPVNIQRWAPLKLTGLISLLSKELSGVSSSTTVWRHQFFGALPSLRSSSMYTTSGKTIALTIRTFVGRVMSLLLSSLSRFVIAFLRRSNCLLISRLQSPSIVILEPKKRKSVTASTICKYIFPPSELSALCYTAGFYLLATLHLVVCICQSNFKVCMHFVKQKTWMM